MVSIDDIPAEARWMIAARSAGSMPMIFDMAFRKAFGDRISGKEIADVETFIMAEGGRAAEGIAGTLGLPVGNAVEIDDTLGIVTQILFGPEFTGEATETMPDRVTFRMTGCAMLNREQELNRDPVEASMPQNCQAFCGNAVESLNPDYALEYTRRMCTGDPHCEYTIRLRK